MPVLKLTLTKGLVLKTKLVLLSGFLTALVGRNYLTLFSLSQFQTAIDNRQQDSEIFVSTATATNEGKPPPLDNTTSSNHEQQRLLVDLEYVELPRGKHPHMGATGPNSNSNDTDYVPDVFHLRNNPPRLALSSDELKRECNNHDRNYEALQRIRIANNNNDLTNRNEKKSKILCGIYSIETNREKYQAIRETWGSKCDGFFIASNQTVPEFDTVNILHAGPEEYKNMYQKVRSIWSYIYDNFYHDFDWFHLGGDDMFVMVENLRAYVESDEIITAAGAVSSDQHEQLQQQVPLFLGSSIAYNGDASRVYQTGGAGYTLNKAALKKLVVEGLPKTPDTRKGSFEDIIIARLFREMNISAFRTTDHDNGVRYHHFGPATHYFAKEPGFYINWTKPLNYNHGKTFSSVHSISFHYVSPQNMRRFYALVYGLCERNSR